MQIFIMRHANAKSIEKFSSDKERSLSKRGYKELDYMTDYLPTELESVPLILCSTAVRTRETLGPVLPFLPEVQQILFLDTLYNASCETILEEINLYKNDFPSVLVIAHNPGVSSFLEKAQISNSLGGNFTAPKTTESQTGEKADWTSGFPSDVYRYSHSEKNAVTENSLDTEAACILPRAGIPDILPTASIAHYSAPETSDPSSFLTFRNLVLVNLYVPEIENKSS